jgi:hypothetical protein
VAATEPAIAPPPGASPGELLRRALRLLAEKRGDAWIDEAQIWPMVKRLDPTFDLAEHGHADFPKMLETLDSLLEIREGETGRQVKLRG